MSVTLTRRLRRLTAVALTAAALVAGQALPSSAATAGVWQFWDYPATGGTYNTDQFLTVTRTAPTRFFAHQIYLQGGDAGYVGLQDTPNGKIAIFSLWNSPTATSNATPGSGAQCVRFSGEGVGWSCRKAYNWSLNVKYRLRIWSTASRSDGSVQWLAAVQNTATGVDTILGSIWSRAGQRQISSSVSWIENYGTLTGSCATEQPARAVFTLPTLDGGGYRARFGLSETAACGTHRSRITRNTTAGTATLEE